jgi:iron complex transport system substrate-binding protein
LAPKRENIMPMRKFTTVVICIFLPGIFLPFLAFSSSQESEPPRRIISLGSTLTEELYLLGAQGSLIADTLYCERPLEAKLKEKVGTITHPSLEKIVSLKPDLVLATSLTNPSVKEKLKNLGIRVVDFPLARNFQELCGHFAVLGKLVGKEDEAKGIIQSARQKVDTLKKNIQDLPKPKIFMQIGANPLFTVTRDYFLNDFIEFAGGINIAADTASGLYSREEVIRKSPDIILITAMGILAEKERQLWLAFTGLNAVKNGRIYVLDSYKFCGPTPVTFVEALKELIEIFHPYQANVDRL